MSLDLPAGKPAALVVVVPAFNEAAILGQVLRRVRAQVPSATVVVVDDGSTDGTAALARAAGARVLSLPFNLGYGAALQTGYRFALEARADVIVQLDADGQHDPVDVARLASGVLERSADIVVGSRFLEDHGYRMNGVQQFARHLFCWLARRFGLRITDPTSGFQALSPAVARFFCSDFFPADYPDLDVLLTAHRRGFRVGEVAVRMAPSPRRSTLHGGIGSLYYVLRMILSLGTMLGGTKLPAVLIDTKDEFQE